MLIQIHTLAVLHYNRAPKTWAYGYLCNIVGKRPKISVEP